MKLEHWVLRWHLCDCQRGTSCFKLCSFSMGNLLNHLRYQVTYKPASAVCQIGGSRYHISIPVFHHHKKNQYFQHAVNCILSRGARGNVKFPLNILCFFSLIIRRNCLLTCFWTTITGLPVRRRITVECRKVIKKNKKKYILNVCTNIGTSLQ